MMRTFQRILLFLGMTILCGMVFCGCSKEENQIKGQTAGSGSGNKENNMSFKAPKMDTAFLLQKAKNGTFTGQSRPDEDGEYAKLLLTIQDHRITAARFEGYLKNGTLKDKDYGKTNGKIENKVYYNKAQLALRANKSYADTLVKTQDLNKVDAISGATISYKALFEAGQMALERAIK